MQTQPTNSSQVTHVHGDYVVVNKAKLWVEVEGSGEPLILLSGGPSNSHLTFHPYFSALAETHRIIYYDYFGRGKSDRPRNNTEVTFERDIEDLEGLRQALGLEQFSLYGFSYGGMVAQGYALKYPARVKKLILANTVHSPEMWQKNHENINREIQNQLPEVWERIEHLRAQGARSMSPELQAEFGKAAALVRFYNPDHISKLMSEPGSRNTDLYFVFAGDDIDFFVGGEVAKLPDFRWHLHQLKMPLMVIAGRYDRALYPRYQMEFKRYAPQAEFVMMEKSGSFAHLEEPEKLIEIVRGFLDQKITKAK